MHNIGQYIFEPNRLIFYKKDISESVLERILSDIQITDKYEQLINTLDSFDKNNMSAKEKPIDLIGVCLTYNCQFRCNYCSYSSTEGNQDNLTADNVVAFVGEAIKKRKIYSKIKKNKNIDPLRFFFTGGGEPTYNWNLFTETVLKIKSKCLKFDIPYYFELTTNGLLNEQQKLFIKQNFNKVMISYDGNPEIQNKNRQSANYKDCSNIVEETIKTFINSELFVVIRSTVWYYDFNKLKDMYDYLNCNFKGIDEWSLMPIIPSGRAITNTDPTEQYNVINNNFFTYYLTLKEYACKDNNIYVSSDFFKNSIAEYCCGASFLHCFWLMPDKSIINCIEAERFKTEVGRISNEKVELYEQYYDGFLDIVKYNFENCRECIAYRFCKGGCPLKQIRDKKYSTKFLDYECTLNKQYWEYIFNKIILGQTCFSWYAETIEINGVPSKTVLQLKNVK